MNNPVDYGQAAYEAYTQGTEGSHQPWTELSEAERENWTAAAQASVRCEREAYWRFLSAQDDFDPTDGQDTVFIHDSVEEEDLEWAFVEGQGRDSGNSGGRS